MTRRRLLLPALALLWCACAPHRASALGPAPAADRPLAFDVTVSGSGRPMILIPGLGCSGEVWSETVERYRDRWQLHVVTIHGFAGTQPFDGPFLTTVREDLARYVRDRGLDHPAIVGHSIGGTLAYALAAEHPELVGPVVAVDGVPFLPALYDPTATPLSARPQALRLGGMLARMSPAQRAAANRRTAAQMVSDPRRVEQIARWVDASDAGTLTRAMVDANSTDLRREVGKIQVPVLLVGEEALFGDAAAAKSAFEEQLSAIPSHTVVIAPGSRHFVMYDAPEVLWRAMDSFLAGSAS